jgi:hypothetical protein
MLNDPGANASGFEPDSKRLGMICAPGTTLIPRLENPGQ